MIDTIKKELQFAIDNFHNAENRESVYNALFRIKAAIEKAEGKKEENENYRDDSGD